MAKKNKTTLSVKLDEFQIMSLEKIADAKDNTRHATIVEAIDEKIERELIKKKK